MSLDSDRDAPRARQVHTLAGNVDSFCPRCGYDLRATLTPSGARCPECGVKLPFDQLRHFNAAAAARRRDLLIAVIVFASLAGLTAVLLALNWPRMTGFPWKAVAGPAMSVLAGGVIAVSLTVALPRLGNYRPDYPTRAFLLTPICLIGALLLHRGYPWVVGGICAISVLAALVSIAWRKCWFDRILRAVRERWSRTVR